VPYLSNAVKIALTPVLPVSSRLLPIDLKFWAPLPLANPLNAPNPIEINAPDQLKSSWNTAESSVYCASPIPAPATIEPIKPIPVYANAVEATANNPSIPA